MRRHLAALLIFLAACGGDAPPPIQTPATPPPQTTAAPPSVTGPKLAFIDEGAKDPEFAAFRQQLIDAVKRRDKDAVLQLADPKIRTSFGGTGGRADLGKRLDQDPKLWQQVESILALGGTFRDGGGRRAFWAPYVYSAFPEDQDAFTTFAVIDDAAPLRETPSEDARVVATLSRDIVTGHPGQSVDWLEVQTADGRKGWVERKYVRSPIDYRAGFGKTEQGWRMDALVAGD